MRQQLVPFPVFVVNTFPENEVFAVYVATQLFLSKYLKMQGSVMVAREASSWSHSIVNTAARGQYFLINTLCH